MFKSQSRREGCSMEDVTKTQQPTRKVESWKSNNKKCFEVGVVGI